MYWVSVAAIWTQSDLAVSAQLWHAYLRERQMAVRGLAIEDPAVSSLNNTYERALVSMHKMPRIWIEYLVSHPTAHHSQQLHRTSRLHGHLHAKHPFLITLHVCVHVGYNGLPHL